MMCPKNATEPLSELLTWLAKESAGPGVYQWILNRFNGKEPLTTKGRDHRLMMDYRVPVVVKATIKKVGSEGGVQIMHEFLARHELIAAAVVE